MEPNFSILVPSHIDFPHHRDTILSEDEGVRQILREDDYVSGNATPNGKEVARHYGISNRTLFLHLLMMSFREFPRNIQTCLKAFKTGLSLPALTSLNASLVYGSDFPGYDSPFPLIDPYRMRDKVVYVNPSLIHSAYEDDNDYSGPALLMGQCFVNERESGYRKVVARIRKGGYWDHTYSMPGGRARNLFYDCPQIREVFEEMPELRGLIKSQIIFVRLRTLSTLDATVSKTIDGRREDRSFLSYACEMDIYEDYFNRKKFSEEKYLRGDEDGNWNIVKVTGPNDHHIAQSIGMRAALISSLAYPIFNDQSEGSDLNPPSSNVYGFYVQSRRNAERAYLSQF